jgi:tRNA-specific 2-thiouridylase
MNGNPSSSNWESRARKPRVVVALSGGVDSSVAAALLHRQGYEVIGITLKLWTPSPWAEGEKFGGCCSPADIADAQNVCRQLGIPHYTFNLEEKFKEKVVDNFVSEYIDGRTPNPCVRCNAFIKFDVLLKYAVALEADALATGHYARIFKEGDTFKLAKAVDPSKDQSYFLYMLTQAQLSKLLFPLGGYDKTQVRAIAGEMGLCVAGKADSMDVCFLEGRSYRDFLNERAPEDAFRKGPIRTRDGQTLGEHQGLPFYTIGQRGNLGVSAGHRLYVIEKESSTNTLVVGTEDENSAPACALESVSWCDEPAPEEPVRATVKIRYRSGGAEATIVPGPEPKIVFDRPQASVTPGQSAVFYDGDVVLGGGVIAARPPA